MCLVVAFDPGNETHYFLDFSTMYTLAVHFCFQSVFRGTGHPSCDKFRGTTSLWVSVPQYSVHAKGMVSPG